MTSPAVPGTSPPGPRPTPEAMSLPRFVPDGFLWGAATAAYQIEGAPDTDGRAPSIWDTFSRLPGRVAGGATGDVACDHYHHLDADLDLLSWLGVSAYRFSVSWPRWMPTGRGRLSPRGAAFYDRLVDGLLQRGIEPWATLYHWDLPQSLQDAGGWPRRDTAHRFADYADSVGRRLGDRVRGFFTLEEPWCSGFLGYAAGVHAPGVQDDGAALRAVHHLLLGHGEAVTALRLQGSPAAVGIAVGAHPVVPLTSRRGDREAVRRIDGLVNRFLLDPLLRGDYPIDVVADLSDVSDFSHIRDGDLSLTAAPIDVLGVNYRGPLVVAAGDTPEARPAREYREAQARQAPAAADGWRPGSPWVGARDVVVTAPTTPTTPAAPVDREGEPSGLPDVLLRLVSDYVCPPLVVTGTGVPLPGTAAGPGDEPPGQPDRRAQLDDQVDACLDVVTEGVDVRGYFAGSFLDGFGWERGYSRRFGIVHVDRDTGRRIPTEGARRLRALTGDDAPQQR